MAGDDHDHEIKIKGGSFDLSDLGHLDARHGRDHAARRRADLEVLLRRQGAEPRAGRVPADGSRQPHGEGRDPPAEVLGGHGRSSSRGSSRPSRKCIDTQDWDGFEAAFATMIEQANAYHEKYDKGFLRWKMPESASA